jgi:hypothetical protein
VTATAGAGATIASNANSSNLAEGSTAPEPGDALASGAAPESSPNEQVADGAKLIGNVDVRERVRLRNGKLLEDLLKTSKDMADAEGARRQTIETKASALLATAGFAITLAVSFGGGTILSHPEYLADLGASAWAVVILFLLALACAVGAAGCATAVLDVTVGWNIVDIEDVFREATLEGADVPEDAEDPSAAEAEGLRFWRQSMIEHLQRVAHANGKINARKARVLRWGQCAFVGFLVAVALLGGAVVFAAYATAKAASSRVPISAAETGHGGVPRGTVAQPVVAAAPPDSEPGAVRSVDSRPPVASASAALVPPPPAPAASR